MADQTISDDDGGLANALARSRHQEAATKDILRIINQSRDDERPVFDAILKHAARLCDAQTTGMQLVNEARTHFRYVAKWGVDRKVFQFGEEWELDSPLNVATAIREARVMHVRDLADDQLYRDRHPVRVRLVEDEGVRSWLVVPLVKDGVAFGSITMSRREVRPFSPADINLVETFAEQAVIAIENVRQFRELQTRLEREAATRDILAVISQSRDDTSPVFDVIVENAARLCKAPMAMLLMADFATGTMQMPAVFGETLRSLELDERWPLDPRFQLAQTILDGRTIQTDDLSKIPLYLEGNPVTVRLVDDEGLRTRLTVPLISEGRGIGCIVLSRRDVAPFAQADIALVETFAEQAVIAIENVRQFRELQARLEREAATGEILGVISQSRNDELPVFEAILKNAQALCGAPVAGLVLATPEDEFQTLAAHRSIKEETRNMFRDRKMPVDPTQTYAAKSIVEGKLIHLPDMGLGELYQAGAPAVRAMVDNSGIRSVVFVPLMKNGAAIGTIALFRYEVKPFEERQIALVETFAAQAVIAIENVRQFRELQTRLEREAATRKILEVISQNRSDTGPVFDAIIENASSLCKAPMAFLSIADEARTRVTIVAALGERARKNLMGFDQPIDATELIAVQPIVTGEVVHLEDCSDDELYRTRNPHRVTLVEEEGIRTILAVPMISNGVSLGAILLYRREVKLFDDDQIELAKTFADQAAIAIENVRQFKALEERTAEVQALNEGLETRVADQVGEIERMGRLKRFLSPQVADAVLSSGNEKLLSSHRALLGILFCDIRGFTAFCETAEPEETIEVLQTYHEEMGALIAAHGAGVDTRAGDGIMVIFNDPLPCDDPAGDALRLGLAMRERMEHLCKGWRRHGHRLGFGVGISLGYATVGMVGSAGRYDYTASGTAVNLAARLCDQAEDGEILLSPRAYTAVEDDFAAESTGELTLKGIHAPVEVFRVTGPR